MPNVAARRVLLPPGSPRRPVPRWLGPAFAVTLLLALAVAFGSAYWDAYQIRREAADLARERERILQENTQLLEEIRLLNTPEYVERLAREQLGLVKPGEIAVILVQPTPAPAPSRPPAQPTTAPWWSRVFGGPR
jgi:cell division protein DivIC